MCEPGEDCGKRDSRPNPLSAFANLRGTGLPWHRVLSLMATNNWRKLRTAQNCCGNYGAPGC